MAIKWFRVGKIVNTHGIRGEVRVISETDFEDERFEVGSKLYIMKEPDSKPVPYIVSGQRRHKQFVLLTFKNHLSLTDVEPLKGSFLYVNEEQLSPLDENEFYYHEIIGCSVFTDEGMKIGTVSEILAPGANDVWVVKTDGKDVLIPYIEDVVKEVDIAEKKIIVHLMDGLLS